MHVTHSAAGATASGVSAPRAFAAAVAGRYGRRRDAIAAPERILARSRFLQVLRIVQGARVTIAPRLTLIPPQRSLAAPADEGDAGEPLRREHARSPRMVDARRSVQHLDVARVATLVERLVTCHSRVEGTGDAAGGSRRPAPVVRVIARAAGAAAVPRTDAGEATGRDGRSWRSNDVVDGGAMVALPPRPRERAREPVGPLAVERLDVDRLTDRVLSAIDRRVTAHRERLGG